MNNKVGRCLIKLWKKNGIAIKVNTLEFIEIQITKELGNYRKIIYRTVVIERKISSIYFKTKNLDYIGIWAIK